MRKLITNLTKLKVLYLSRNVLHELHQEAFLKFAKSLRILRVNNNRLTSVNESSLPWIMWNRLKVINLRDNPWICDCRIVWFRRWLRNSTNQKKFPRFKTYECSSLGQRIPIIKLMTPTDIECFEVRSDWLLVSLFVCVLSVHITSVVASLLHRYRWHAKYFSFVIQVM